MLKQFLATAVAFSIVTGSVTGKTCIQHTLRHLLAIVYDYHYHRWLARLMDIPLILFGLATSNHIDFTDCTLS
jgi:hypothetical protein